MYNENSTTPRELQERFTVKKRRSIKTGDSFRRTGYKNRAANIHWCGENLMFAECQRDNYHKLIGAYFCHDRFCPMCNWRRSRLLTRQIMQILHAAVERQPLRFIFLTLTTRNPSGADLSAEIDRMFKGWHRLTMRKQFKSAVVGWIRNLEVTYNSAENTYNPHFHVLIAVQPGYFDGNKGKYINQSEWTSLWQECAELDYKPIVNVKAVKPKNPANPSYTNAALEVGKYSIKDSDYIRPTEAETDKVLLVLIPALRGRKLLGFGDLFRTIKKELKLEDIESDNANLIGDDEEKKCTCPICNSTLKEVLYTWNFSASSYVRNDV